MFSKLAIGFIGYIALMTMNHAQTVTVTGNIPYAADLKKQDGSLKVWTMSKIREDKHETVNPIEGSVMIKDNNSLGDKLGDRSYIPKETKPTYYGTLDLTNTVLPATIAILVDDIATLTITEIPTGNEPAGHTPFTDTYKVEGTALWNPKSYKEFPTPLPPGRKYQLDLVYTNTANLTANYTDGKVDVDGVSVYVSLLPVEVEVRGYVTGERQGLSADALEMYRHLIPVPPTEDYTEFKTEPKTELKIVQWGDNKIFDPNDHSNFVQAKFKEDVDIFRIRLPDIDPPIGTAEHRVKIWTVDAAGTTLDEGAEVDLNVFNNFHETAALGLVADDETDDTFVVEGKADGALGDRTYRAKLGGKLKFQWLTCPGNGEKPTFEIPIPIKKIVTAKGFILKGTTDAATATYWFDRAKKIYSAIGVDLQYTLKTIDPLPAGVNLSNKFDIPNEIAGYLHEMRPETKALMDHHDCQVDPGTIPVFFVNELEPAAQGVTNVPSYMAPGDEKYGGAIFIDSTHEQESVLAHELAHVLLDAQHYPSSNALWDDYFLNFDRGRTNIWFGNQGELTHWSETGIKAHRRLADTMRSRIWKSPYAKAP